MTSGVVKRGGNLRWINPTNVNPNSGGVSEVKQVPGMYNVAGSILTVGDRALRGTIDVSPSRPAMNGCINTRHSSPPVDGAAAS